MTHSRKTYALIALILTTLFVWTVAADPIGLGSYTTTLPAGGGVPSDIEGNPVTPKVTDDFDQTMLTNQWWSSLIWQYFPDNPYSVPLFAHPLTADAEATGLELGYPTFYAINNEFHAHHQADLLVGLVGLDAPRTEVAGYSDWTVTARWEDGSNMLEATIGHGLPYAYFTTGGGTAEISLPTGAATVWHNDGAVLGLTINNHHYGIFAPTGSTWSGTAPFQSSLNGETYFSVAVLPDDSAGTLEKYRQHAYAFVTDSQVSWTYDESIADLRTEYNATTTLMESGNGQSADTMLALYRHQWINSNDVMSGFTYESPRGEMKVVDSSSFSTNMRFNGVLPGLPDMGDYDRTQLYDYVDDVYTEAVASPLTAVSMPTDTYWGGKAVGRLAALLPIAEQVGHTAAVDEFVAQMKDTTEDWLNADDGGARLLYYNDTWDTMIGYPASFFADTQLNDHHFHYGYWVMAAAAIARYDSAWAEDDAWGGMVEQMILESTNPDRSSTMYPFMRYFDPYAGHGWANGPALFAAGNNQESSSEGQNYATALILWGEETGDTTMRDLGIYLYINTVHAVEQYWFDVDEEVFPDGYEYETVGMVWGNGGAFSTWWTGNPEEIHGINMLPYTGGSLYLGRRPDYIQRNYDHLLERNLQHMIDNDIPATDGTETEWVEIIWKFQALADPAAALAKFGDGNYTGEAGETKAHTYHWLHNLNVMGQLDTGVTGDVPTYAVFNDNGTRTYVGYNSGDAPIVVTYSDGICLDVGAGQIEAGAGRMCDTPAITPTPTNTPLPVMTAVPSSTPNPDVTQVVPPTAIPPTVDPNATAAPTVPPANDFTATVASIDATNAQVQFTPDFPVEWVIIHYAVDGGGQQNVNMVDDGSGLWTLDVSNLSDGSTIDYWFTYFDGSATDSGSALYTHGDGTQPIVTATSMPSATAVPNTTPVPSSDEFMATAEYIDPFIAQIQFVPETPMEWVIVHYAVDGGGEQNVNMIDDGSGRWTLNVQGLSGGTAIDYWFTYFDTSATDSDTLVYTHGAAQPPTAPLAIGLGTAEATPTWPILTILLGIIASTSLFVKVAE